MGYKLSIIIPHYNCIEGLCRLLETIPKREEIQVIIVDDNSYVSIPSEIKTRENVTVLNNYTKQNSAGTCRNIGLDNAIGEWVLFADADDYFVGNWYEKVQNYFPTNCEAVFFVPTSIQLDTGEKDVRHLQYEELLCAYLNAPTEENFVKVRFNYYVPHSKLIKREFLVNNNIRFDNTLVSNDLMFSTLVGHKSKKIHVSSDVIYCITRGKGSLTTCKNKRNYYIRHQVGIRRAAYLFSNLTKKEISYVGMDILGIRFLYSDLKNGMGIKYVFQDLKRLKRENVPLVTGELFNPIRVLRYVSGRIIDNRKYKIDTRYTSKKGK